MTSLVRLIHSPKPRRRHRQHCSPKTLPKNIVRNVVQGLGRKLVVDAWIYLESE